MAGLLCNTSGKSDGGPLYGKLSQCRLLGQEDHRLQVAAGRTWNAVGQRP